MENESQIEKAFEHALKLVDFKFEDAALPTESERQQLSRLLYLAFCDFRILAREGRTEQAQLLADAFHNVPLLMYGKEFSFRVFRDAVTRYQERFSHDLITNFLEELDKMSAKKN